MSKYVELEIQKLLQQSVALDQIAAQLISKLEGSKSLLTMENISSLAQFLSHAGFHLSLVEFILRHLDQDKFTIPWAHFLESLHRGTKKMDLRAADSLIEGIEELKMQAAAARAQSFAQYEPEITDWLSERQIKIQEEYLASKRLQLDQLMILRTQLMFEEEKELLNQLQAQFPEDPEILAEVASYRQRHALEILARRVPAGRAPRLQFIHAKDEELEKVSAVLKDVLLETAEKEPELIKDIAIAAYVLESHDTALEILNLIPTLDASYAWLRLEILLAGRRFVELLGELYEVELALAHDPETFFATSYLRAQAYWGLGQKNTALEVIEGLLASRPHYRSASTLHSLWSSQWSSQ